MLNVDRLLEKVDYELSPVDGHPNDQSWQVRLLRGEYVETVIRFGNIAFNPELQCLNFNFFIVSSPDPDLTVKDKDLQEHVARVLEQILDKAQQEGYLMTKEQGAPDSDLWSMAES